jgi:probable F420-dependent oxidoreductase
MLELAGARTQGAIPYNTTPAHTASARAKIPAGKWLAVEQKVSLETDPATARALGRKELARYLALENYRNSWLGMGFSEADLSDGGSDRFIDAMLLWGDEGKVKAGLRAHFAAGATHLCIQPVHNEGDTATRDRILAALADT